MNDSPHRHSTDRATVPRLVSRRTQLASLRAFRLVLSLTLLILSGGSAIAQANTTLSVATRLFFLKKAGDSNAADLLAVEFRAPKQDGRALAFDFGGLRCTGGVCRFRLPARKLIAAASQKKPILSDFFSVQPQPNGPVTVYLGKNAAVLEEYDPLGDDDPVVVGGLSCEEDECRAFLGSEELNGLEKPKVENGSPCPAGSLDQFWFRTSKLTLVAHVPKIGRVRFAFSDCPNTDPTGNLKWPSKALVDLWNQLRLPAGASLPPQTKLVFRPRPNDAVSQITIQGPKGNTLNVRASGSASAEAGIISPKSMLTSATLVRWIELVSISKVSQRRQMFAHRLRFSPNTVPTCRAGIKDQYLEICGQTPDAGKSIEVGCRSRDTSLRLLCSSRSFRLIFDDRKPKYEELQGRILILREDNTAKYVALSQNTAWSFGSGSACEESAWSLDDGVYFGEKSSYKYVMGHSAPEAVLRELARCNFEISVFR